MKKELQLHERFKNNPNLKKVGVQQPLFEEEVSEIIKCAKDIEHFTEKYVKIINMDGGLVDFKLYPYQKKIVKHFHENRFSICKTARQMGKCIRGNSEIVVRNKKTGKVETIEIEKFFNKVKGGFYE